MLKQLTSLLKTSLTKYLLIGTASIGLISGIFVTRFLYADEMKELNKLNAEKEIYMELKQNQADQIDSLTELLYNSQDTISSLNRGKVNNVEEQLSNSDFIQCPISDELLNALDSVGKSEAKTSD